MAGAALPQQCLYLSAEPQGQGALRARTAGSTAADRVRFAFAGSGSPEPTWPESALSERNGEGVRSAAQKFSVACALPEASLRFASAPRASITSFEEARPRCEALKSAGRVSLRVQ